MLDELWDIVFNRLTPRDRVRCSQVSRHFRKVVSDMEAWSALREKLNAPRVRPRAWRRKTDFSVVVAHACVRCRARRRLPRQPLCTHCLASVPGPAGWKQMGVLYGRKLGKVRRNIQHIHELVNHAVLAGQVEWRQSLIQRQHELGVEWARIRSGQLQCDAYFSMYMDMYRRRRP